jgi:hypothetical protein
MKRGLLVAGIFLAGSIVGVSFALGSEQGPCGGEMVGHAIFTAPDHPEFDLVADDSPESAVARFLALVESKSIDQVSLTATRVDDTTYVVSGGRVQMGVTRIEDKFVVTTSAFCAEDNVPGLYSTEP